MGQPVQEQYRLTFRHVQFADGCRRRGTTIAQLSVMAGHDVVRGWFGVATCSRRDEFHKKIGRRLALARLLDAIPYGVSGAVETEAHHFVHDRLARETSLSDAH